MGFTEITGLKTYKSFVLTAIARRRTMEVRILKGITIVPIAGKRLLLILHGALSVQLNTTECTKLIRWIGQIKMNF